MAARVLMPLRPSRPFWINGTCAEIVFSAVSREGLFHGAPQGGERPVKRVRLWIACSIAKLAL